MHQNPALAVGHGLDLSHRPHTDLSAARTVGFLDAFGSENYGSCGEIRSFDDL